MFRFLIKRGLLATAVFAVLCGVLFTNQQAQAESPASPHLAGLKRPDTGPMRKYVADAMGDVTRIRDSVFANEDTNRDVMHDLADGTKSYINQAKIAAEACDRAAYDAAIAKINAWDNTLDGLIADAEKAMKGKVGPGSIENTMNDVTKPFDDRAKSLRRSRTAAQGRLDAAAKAEGIGPAILSGLGEKNALPPDVAGPYNEVRGYDQALSELSGITFELDSLASDYRRNHEFGEKVLKALNEWKAKLQAARAGIPPFPEDCGGTASSDTYIGLRDNQSATDTNGVAVNGQAPAQTPIPDDRAPINSSWDWNGGINIGTLNRGSTGVLGTDDTVTIAPNNLLFLENEEDFEEYFFELVHRFGVWGALWEVSFAYHYGHSDGDQLIERVSPGAGNRLSIFSPQGVNGGLGGGLGVGFRDAVGIHHSNDNEFHEFSTAFFGNLFNGPAMAIRGGLLASYGGWDLTERIHGSIEGINQTFAYRNIAEVSTYSIGAGVELEHDIGTIGDTPVEFYGGMSFERQFHDNDGHSTLDLSGTVNATERQDLSGDEETNRFTINAGFAFGLTKKLDLNIGASFRSYSTPEVRILPSQVAYINLSDANEFAGFIRLVVGLGPPVHESPILTGATQSDRRLKRDIAHVVTLDSGIKLYSFKYLWDDQVHIGVMAQDLLANEAFRDAVVLKPNGFYAVDYGKLGLKMTTLHAWREYGLAAVMLRQMSGGAGASLTLPLR